MRLGLVSYGTGAEVNCPTGVGVAAEFELAYGSVFRFGPTFGMKVAIPPGCTAVGTIRQWQGRQVDEFSELHLIAAPDVGVFAEYAADFGRVVVAPGLRSGVLFGTHSNVNSQRTLVPHIEAQLGIRSSSARSVGVLIRGGQLRAPVSWEYYDGSWNTARSFGRWQHLVVVSLTYAW